MGEKLHIFSKMRNETEISIILTSIYNIILEIYIYISPNIANITSQDKEMRHKIEKRGSKIII